MLLALSVSNVRKIKGNKSKVIMEKKNIIQDESIRLLQVPSIVNEIKAL